MDYYFSEENLAKDHHMRTLIDQENDQGYVLIDKIIGSKKKMIMNKAKKIDIVEIAEYS
jgi:hypothetical protein